MRDDRTDLTLTAQRVLEANRHGAYTCPSNTLYPHQWLWDSCFIAIGLATYDAERAAQEMRALLHAQWTNGMLPHMIFWSGRSDAGTRNIWRSASNALAPRDVDTSCITQPPLPAIAVARVAAHLPPDRREAFLVETFPKLVAYHRWLYDERDLSESGLVTLIHPWECGLDTTPPWMNALRAMEVPTWLAALLRVHAARLVRVFRRDTRYLPASERSSDDDGLRMLVLAHRARRHAYALRAMPAEESVLIEDLAFNSILLAANAALREIATEVGAIIDAPLDAAMHRSDAALEQLFDPDAGCYRSRDATTGTLLPSMTVATLLPLLAPGLPQERVERLVALLDDPNRFATEHPVPSVACDDPDFQELRYWKGPTWVNTNWLVIEGLRTHGRVEHAERLRASTLALVERGGCFEYFSARTGEGHGAPDFSWTAALTLDLAAMP